MMQGKDKAVESLALAKKAGMQKVRDAYPAATNAVKLFLCEKLIYT